MLIIFNEENISLIILSAVRNSELFIEKEWEQLSKQI